jgi:phospholipid-binding lipoprotein MlaA
MKTSLRLQFALASAFLLTLSSCASRKSESTQTALTVPSGGSVSGWVEKTDALDDYGGDKAADPFEKLNRITFEFNEDVYRFVVRPISKGCTTLTPKPVRKGIDNVFDNLRFPGRVVNSSLQGKMGLAGKEVQEFGMNTVLGVGGLFKASDKVPSLVDLPEEDALQTLAVWGARFLCGFTHHGSRHASGWLRTHRRYGSQSNQLVVSCWRFGRGPEVDTCHNQYGRAQAKPA